MPSAPAPHSRESESALVARIRSGDAAAFEALFHTFYSELTTFAYRYVRARDVAEEIVHNVLARLWERRERFELRDQLRTYLYTAVRNEALSQLRHWIVERRWRDRALRQHRAEVVAYSPTDAEARIESDELAAAFARALAHLPDRCQLALTLRVQRQMTNAEVAAAMGVSIKSVEAYITRALAALRERHAELLPYL